MLVRHGKAMDRKDWSKKDTLRPLGARGRKQARQLVPFLASYGIENLISSTSARCLTTLEPYAAKRRIAIETHDTLTEEIGTVTRGVGRLIGKIREGVLGRHRLPTAICVHRPVLPTILEALELAPAASPPCEMLITHLTADDVHAIERYRPQA